MSLSNFILKGNMENTILSSFTYKKNICKYFDSGKYSSMLTSDSELVVLCC